MGHFQPVVGVPNLELRPLERFFYLVQEGSLALISVSGTCPEETAGVRFSGIESGLSCARTDCTRRRKPVVYSHSKSGIRLKPFASITTEQKKWHQIH